MNKASEIDLQLCYNTIDLLDAVLFKNIIQVQLNKNVIQTIFSIFITKILQFYLYLKSAKIIKLTAIISCILAIGIISLVLVNLIANNKPQPLEITISDNTDNLLELQRIIEHQEALSAQIEQLRNQISENQIHPISIPQQAQSVMTDQQQLIDRLNNELLMEVLADKRQSMRDITGNILVQIVPINYRNRNFRINSNNLRNTVNESLNIISQHASEYNINISFDVVNDNGNNGSFISINNSTEAMNLYQRFLNPKYNFTVLVLVIDTVERSYITRRADYSHAIMWFREQNGYSANTLAHEIYHALGAEDLYYEQGVVSREVEQNFITLLGNSIMLSSQFTGLDPINAWLIGWNKNPDPWFAWFVNRRDTSNINFF